MQQLEHVGRKFGVGRVDLERAWETAERCCCRQMWTGQKLVVSVPGKKTENVSGVVCVAE